jgi:hypothetical protein
MSHFFTNAEYADMLYVYGFCAGSATTVVEDCTVETNFERRLSIDVWCSMIDDMLIDPIILDDHLTEHDYLDFLQKWIIRTTKGCSFDYTDCYVLSA